MNDFLKSTKENLSSGNYAGLSIVLGNESCDLDSAVSALGYAAFLHWQHQRMKCKVCTRNKRTEPIKDDIFVPILNVDREDFEIKTEVAYCLARHGLDAGNLVFRDEHDLPALVSSSTNVILVDHHILADADRFLAPHVTEIIDHRPADRARWCYRDDTRATMELVGSCASLVAQRIRDLSALFAEEQDFFVVDKVCTDMLHSTILVDTVNFSKEVKKGTPRDEEVVLFLETILKPGDYAAERVRKLDALVSARKDVSSLTCPQLLRKDVKVEQDVLVPSFPLLVREFLGKEGASEAVRGALQRRGCSVAVLLGMELTAGLRRDVAVCSADSERRDQLCAFLQAWEPSLELSEDTSSDNSLRYFSQRNLSASRKQYMPALKHFLSLK